MYYTLLILHSLNRWLVLASLLYAIWLAWNGYRQKRSFTKTDNTVRHVTATISHIQLTIGMCLYMISPLVRSEANDAGGYGDLTFFRIVHAGLMLISVVVITIGSAKAKRVDAGPLKFRTMLIWFAIGLLIMLTAVPWPFSPLAARPYYRIF